MVATPMWSAEANVLVCVFFVVWSAEANALICVFFVVHIKTIEHYNSHPHALQTKESLAHV